MVKLYSLFIFLFVLTSILVAEGEWHVELDHWPRTVLESESIQLVRDRVLTEPYTSFYSRILVKSETDYDSFSDQRDKSEICRSAAFRFLIDSDSLYAQKALDYLLTAQREPADGYLETYDNIIWDSETLTSICTAYDFLKGNNYDFGTEETTIRDNIKEIAGGLYEDIMDHYLIHMVWEAGGKKTNFGVKLASALGIAAIVLNNESSTNEFYQPLNWINYSMNLLHDHFYQYLVDDNGGWAEGQHYQKFITFNLIPFIFAQANFIDGATETYGDLTLPPWLDDEQFKKSQEIGIALRMPDGTRPNFDDSFNNPHYINGIFSQYYDNDIFAWDYLNAPLSCNTYVSPGYLDIEMICLFDDSYSGTTTPDYLTRFLPEAGQAVFRNDWSEEAVYMCLLGEHGIARTGGRAHEHPDNTSFILFAYGELLAMDSGYLSFEQHDLVRYAKNHSLILVDGEGPSEANTAASGGTDAFIRNYFDLPLNDFAEVSTSYENTDFSRNMSFIDNSFFVISDIVSSSEEHTYDWLLHGNGGGTTENLFEFTENSATYNVNGIELNLFITSNQPLTLTSYDDYHEAGYENAAEHAVTKATIQADSASFSAFIIPTPENSDIIFSPLNIANCSGGIIQMDNQKTLTVAKPDHEPVTVEFDENSFTTNAITVNLSNNGNEIPVIIQLKDFTDFQFNEVNLIHSSIMVDLALNISSTAAEGFVSDACQLDLFTGNLPSAFTGISSYTYNNGLLSITFEEGGYFSLDVEWSLVNTGTSDDILDNTVILEQNFPNPFNPKTSIGFNLPIQSNVNLIIYNIHGQKIRTILDNPILDKGRHEILWDGMDDNGYPNSSGIYFYQLRTEKVIQTKKMILLK